MTTPEQKKEIARVKMASYNRQPERMAKNRQISIKRSKVRKLETTGKRFQEHTIDELLTIAHQRCIASNADWDANKDEIERVLRILHWSQDVLSRSLTSCISAQST